MPKINNKLKHKGRDHQNCDDKSKSSSKSKHMTNEKKKYIWKDFDSPPEFIFFHIFFKLHSFHCNYFSTCPHLFIHVMKLPIITGKLKEKKKKESWEQQQKNITGWPSNKGKATIWEAAHLDIAKKSKGFHATKAYWGRGC